MTFDAKNITLLTETTFQCILSSKLQFKHQIRNGMQYLHLYQFNQWFYVQLHKKKSQYI